MANSCAADTLDPVFFEYIETADNINGFVLNPISAAQAFRKYDWIKGAPVNNVSGNLRGMVINARMRTLYNISSKVGDKLALVGMLIEVSKEMGRMQDIYQSNASSSEKFSHITILGSAAILRSVTSIVPTAWHLVSKSAQGYAQLYSAVSGSPSGNQVSDAIGKLDAQITEIHGRQWDGENWYQVISATVK